MATDWSSFQVEFDRGDTGFLDFAVVLSGVAQNLTGWTLWFTAKRRLADADPGVFQKTTATGGVTITNAAGGLGSVNVQPTDTAGLPEERTTLFADLQGKDGGGNIFTLAKGTLIVRGDATQATT